MTPVDGVAPTSHPDPQVLATETETKRPASRTAEDFVESRDLDVLSAAVKDMALSGKAGEQFGDIVSRYHDAVGNLYQSNAQFSGLGNFSGVVGNLLSAPATLRGEDNTGCKHTQLTSYQAIAPLTSLDSDAWQAAPVRVGTGPFVHNAVAVWSSDVSLEDAPPDEVLMFDPWPQQSMQDSVRTLDEWQSLNSISPMMTIRGMREVDL